MTLEAELVDNKEQIFKRPRNLKDILRGRSSFVETNSFEDIIPALETKKQNQVLIIHSNVEIIPKDQKGNSKFYNAQNYSKRGQAVRLYTFDGVKSRLIKNKWGATRARIQASKEEKYRNSDEHYIGWYWHDTKGIAHVLHPTTVIEGHRIHAFALKSTSIEDKIEFPKTQTGGEYYHAHDSNLRTVRVLVPSRSERKHVILMENLTSPEDPEAYVQWTRFNTRHKCKHKEEDFSFRFRDYVTYCPHDIAAHVAYSRKIAQETGKIIQQPFPLFREATLRLYLSLAYDTIKIDTKTENGKLRTKQRPLTLAEIDPILMRTWLQYRNFNTFYVPSPKQGYKKMSEYNWAISADGMRFKED